VWALRTWNCIMCYLSRQYADTKCNAKAVSHCLSIDFKYSHTMKVNISLESNYRYINKRQIKLHWFSEKLLHVYYAFPKNSFWSSSWDRADSHTAVYPSMGQSLISQLGSSRLQWIQHSVRFSVKLPLKWILICAFCTSVVLSAPAHRIMNYRP